MVVGVLSSRALEASSRDERPQASTFDPLTINTHAPPSSSRSKYLQLLGCPKRMTCVQTLVKSSSRRYVEARQTRRLMARRTIPTPVRQPVR